MPTYEREKPPKIRDTTPASTLRKQMQMGSGVFRCDRCDRVIPEHLMVEQDGWSLCSTLCADSTSRTEQQVQLAKDLSAVDSWAANKEPPTNAFSGAVTITSTPTWPVRIVNDGAAVQIVLGGIGFTSDIVISYSDAGITDDTAPVITSTQITLSLVASGVTPGRYNLTVHGSTEFQVLEVIG